MLTINQPLTKEAARKLMALDVQDKDYTITQFVRRRWKPSGRNYR